MSTSRSAETAAELVPLMEAALQRCNLQPSESLMVYSDTLGRAEYAAAFLAAGSTLGAETFEVIVPSVNLPKNAADPTKVQRAAMSGALLELAINVDMIIDVSSKGMLHSKVQRQVLQSGTRMLRVREPASCLARLFPEEELIRRVKKSGAMLHAGRALRMRSTYGTDLRVEKGDRPVTMQYGCADEAGRWDHWATGLVALPPLEDKADGTLVIAPGDIFFLSATVGHYVTRPIHMQLEEGCIVDIDAGGEGVFLREALRRTNEPDAFRISHIGWGCDPRADWGALALLTAQGGGGADIRSYEAGVVVAFGANADLGGANESKAHMDLAFQSVDFEVDGELVIKDGAFLSEDLL